MQTDIHALSEIQTHDPSVRVREYSLCLRRTATVIGNGSTTDQVFYIRQVRKKKNGSTMRQ
jgi:hypothetical protein